MVRERFWTLTAACIGCAGSSATHGFGEPADGAPGGGLADPDIARRFALATGH